MRVERRSGVDFFGEYDGGAALCTTPREAVVSFGTTITIAKVSNKQAWKGRGWFYTGQSV